MAFVFGRQKTQNQQFQVSRKTAYIFTFLNHFTLKVPIFGRLGMLETFDCGSALTWRGYQS